MGFVALNPSYKNISPTLTLRRWNARLVETALDHRVDFAHQDVGRHLVLGAAELSQRCEESEVIEGLGRQRQAQRPRLRAVFRSRHLGSYASTEVFDQRLVITWL